MRPQTYIDEIRAQRKSSRKRQPQRDDWEHKNRDIIQDYKNGFKDEEVSIQRLRHQGFGERRAKELLK